jgi:homoserine dehydrogenase
VTTTVLDRAVRVPVAGVEHPGPSAICRIGLLGLGNVGSAFARLARDPSASFAAVGFTPAVAAALVRSPAKPRGSDLAPLITDDREAFFAEPVDLVVEALGGVDPAFTLVSRALARGIPVVTANKSLIAAHGDELSRIARRHGTALRYEAACMAGVPFLGTFERRPLAARASGVTAILNGTSNYILSALAAGGGSFAGALADAQRLGYAEPDPSMDISGADAAEKLTILIRLFGRLVVEPARIPLDAIAEVDGEDMSAAAAWGGAIRPLARAAWRDTAIRAHVGPAFVGGTHALAHVAGVSNGIVIDAERGTQCYIGPGAGPEVTAATLLDDVAEVVTERRVRTPACPVVEAATAVTVPDSAWFLRLGGALPSDIADLLGSYGIWCTRLERRGARVYALTCSATPARIHAALDAVRAATGADAAGVPAIVEEASC